MTNDEWKWFTNTAESVVTKPKQHFAKKVARVTCKNPNQEISYSYERIYRIGFVDGTHIEVSNDYVHGMTKMAPGGYVIAVRPDYTWGFVTEEEFKEIYQ